MAVKVLAKRGTAAQIEGAASSVQSAGEIAFATDTKDFYVSDGTQFNKIGTSDLEAFEEITIGLDLDTWHVNPDNFLDVTTDSSPTEVTFKPDGTRVFVLGSTTRTVLQYDLSTAWDLTTAGSVTQSSSLTTLSGGLLGGSLEGLYIDSTGTRLYALSRGSDSISQYTIDTAWDISSLTFVQDIHVNSTVGGGFVIGDNNPRAMTFKPDGTVIYIAGYDSDEIHQVPLSTAWDISTHGTITSISYDPPANVVTGIQFSSDGTMLFTIDDTGESIEQWTLSTAWDITTLALAGVSLPIISMYETTPQGLYYSDTLAKAFVVGSSRDFVWEIVVEETVKFSKPIHSDAVYGRTVNAHQINVHLEDDGINGIRVARSNHVQYANLGYAILEFGNGSGQIRANSLAFYQTLTLSNGDAFKFLPNSGRRLTDTDAEQAFMLLSPDIGQSGTANYVGLLMDVTETSVGSGTNSLMDLRVGGTSKFTVRNSGKVGIGTDNPVLGGSSGLNIYDVNYPQLKLTSAVTGTGVTSGFLIGLTANDGGEAQIVNYENAGIRFKTNYTDRFIISKEGNIGIGTTAPTYPLHVVGDTYISTGLAVGTSLVYANGVNINNSGQYRIGNAAFISKNANDMNIYQGRMWVQQAGNVGIGTTSPTEKLHVQGTAPKFKLHNTNGFDTFIELYTGSGYSGINLNKDFYINGYNGSPLWTAEGGLIIANQYFYGGYINFRKRGTTTNLAQIGLETGSNTYFNTGNFGIGTTSPDSKLHIQGSFGSNTFKVKPNADHTVIEAGQEFRIATTNSGDIKFQPGGVIGMFISGTNRNVGIGTTAPASDLSVSGRADISSRLRVGAAGNPNKTLEVWGDQIFATSGGATWATFDQSEEKVGIGTTTPLQPLHVNGNIQQEGASSSVLLTGGGEVRGTNQLLVRSLASYLALGGQTSTLFQIAGSEVARFDSSGNLGIGTTSPAEKLDVTGNIKATRVVSDILRDTNNNGHLVTTVTNASNTATVVGHLATANTLTLGVKSAGNVVAPNGNFGIGTSSPAAKLHVATSTSGGNPSVIIQDNGRGQTGTLNYVSFTEANGSSQAKVGFQSTLNGTFTLANLIGDVDITSTGQVRAIASSNFIVQTAGSQHFIVNNLGNVGISTTSPSVSLDVDGEVHLGPQSATGFPSIDIASNGRTTIRASAPALSVRDNNNNGGYIDMGGGTLANINSITSSAQLSFSSTNVRFGGDIAARVNIVGQDSSSQNVLGLKQGTSGSNIMIDIRDSSNVSTMGITSEGGFYFRDSDLVGRYTFDHDYAPSPADGLTTGFEFRTENASGVLTTFGYIDVTNDDRTAQESSMRLSVGQSTPTEIMRLQSDGNVGIGTTLPDAKLHVSTTSGTAFKVNPNNTNKEWYIDTTNPDHLKKGQNLILHADPTNVHTSTSISFNIDGSNKMRIQDNGRVGIGTTSPSGHFHVIDSGNLSDGGVFIENTGATAATLGLENTEGTSRLFTNNGITTLRNIRTGFSSYSIDIGGRGVKIKEGNGGQNSDASAILDIDSTTQGVLFPRMTEADKDSISSPATGLIIYQTDAQDGLYIYKSSGWVQII